MRCAGLPLHLLLFAPLLALLACGGEDALDAGVQGRLEQDRALLRSPQAFGVGAGLRVTYEDSARAPLAAEILRDLRFDAPTSSLELLNLPRGWSALKLHANDGRLLGPLRRGVTEL